MEILRSSKSEIKIVNSLIMSLAEVLSFSVCIRSKSFRKWPVDSCNKIDVFSIAAFIGSNFSSASSCDILQIRSVSLPLDSSLDIAN